MPTPAFEVQAEPADTTGDTLVAGFSLPGMAGLSASDYLVTEHDFEQIGYVRTRGLPAIAPFEEGTPRHPIQLYADSETNVTVLVCELFVPVSAAEAFADGLLSWLEETTLSDIAVLHGVPFQHGPESHDVFVTATPGFRERRLDGVELTPMSGGFLDGVLGELTLRGLEADGIGVGALITPSHPPGPDLEAALLLLEALGQVTDVTVDSEELEASAERLRAHYAELAERLAESEAEQFPEDRMFM